MIVEDIPVAESEAPSPVISVVIPHYQQPDTLARALHSLDAQRDAPPFEVLVVDNASAQAPVEVCAGHALVRLLSEPTKGPGPARTTGARAARAPIIAFIDADCEADPDWLSVIARTFAERPDVDVLGGEARILPIDSARMNALECYEEVFSYRQRLFVERDHYAATLNMAVRASVFAEVGPFGGLSMAEDRDWGRRAHAAGKTIVYVPQMRIATPARETFEELARKWDRQIGHDYHPVRGRPIALAIWALKTAAMPFSPIAAIPEIMAAPRLADGAARRRAFAMLARTRLWRARRMVELMAGRDPESMAAGWRQAPP
jgi:cellulose synthase/poly-beta-1,6-N-acetylglucosamine synthase-like glycosyltransferase